MISRHIVPSLLLFWPSLVLAQQLGTGPVLGQPSAPEMRPLAELWSKGSGGPVRGELTAGLWWAALSGQLHTPAGGGAGTTSHHRPTVGEIDLDDPRWMPTADARIRLGPLKQHELHLSWALVDRSGSATLQSGLISQNRIFPAGSRVRSGLSLDMLRAGYRPHFYQWHLIGAGLLPEVGISTNGFHYTLSSPTVDGRVDRAYHITFPYLGLLLKKPICEQLALELDTAGSIWFSGAYFVDGQIRLVHNLAWGKLWQPAVVVGWRGTWLRYHDHQEPEQNEPNMRLGAFSSEPWTGLTLQFRLSF